LRPRFDVTALNDEAMVAVDIVRKIQLDDPNLYSWINFPLLNRTGDHRDLQLKTYDGLAKQTSYAINMPGTMKVIRWLLQEGFDIEYSRVAVLIGRDLLRCHVDMYTPIRLIVPLTEQGNDFRHVFGDYCVVMRVGELWTTNSQVCHGAANIGNDGYRVALLVDARAETSRFPEW